MLIPVIYCTIGYWLTGLVKLFDAFIIFVAVGILVGNNAIAFGSSIGIVAPTINAAFNLNQPFVILFLTYGGFYLNVNSIADYFIWIKYLSWFFYANEILQVNQWEKVSNITCGANETVCYFNGREVLESLNLNPANFRLDFLWLVLLYLLWRVLGFLALTIRTKLRY